MRKNKFIEGALIIVFHLRIVCAPRLFLRFIGFSLISEVSLTFEYNFLLCFEVCYFFLEKFVIEFKFLDNLDRKDSTWSLSPNAYLSDSISLASMMQLSCSFFNLT